MGVEWSICRDRQLLPCDLRPGVRLEVRSRSQGGARLIGQCHLQPMTVAPP